MTDQARVSEPKLWNVPNILTMLRIVFAFIVFFIFPFKLYITCLILFIIAAASDFVDGWWARKYNQKTQFGRIMDPFADKALVCGTFVCLVSRPELHDLFNHATTTCGCPLAKIPLGLATWMVVMIILRELFVTMLRSMVESSGGDFSAKWVGKWKTGIQCVDIPLAFLILYYVSEEVAAPMALKIAFLLCFYVVVFLTLYSGWIYIRAALNMNKKAKASAPDVAADDAKS